jgi:ActR/RegA family two-component response regulator
VVDGGDFLQVHLVADPIHRFPRRLFEHTELQELDAGMWRVLVVDDDEGTRNAFSVALRNSGFETFVAESGQQGIEIAVQTQPEIALIDLRLPDMSGLTVLQELRRAGSFAHLIMMTGFATTQTAVEAMRLGALDYLEKPIDVDSLIELVESVTGSGGLALKLRHADDTKLHAATRWAQVVIQAIDAPADPKTLHGWGRSVGVSHGAIRNWCRTAHIRPKRSLDFARLLRAVIKQREGLRPEDLLDVVDLRTLAHLLKMGQTSSNRPAELPSEVEEFLQTQRWITSTSLLDEVRRQLRYRLIPGRG